MVPEVIESDQRDPSEAQENRRRVKAKNHTSSLSLQRNLRELFLLLSSSGDRDSGTDAVVNLI